MTSSARVDGSITLPGTSSAAVTTVLGRGWAVDYDFAADRVEPTGQPRRISSWAWPAPFDGDLDGMLRGQGTYAGYVYLFKAGQYLRLDAATLTPTGPPAPTAPAWYLPPGWTGLDAVFAGGGVKSGYAYFFRGTEYQRYQWSNDSVYPAPKPIAPNWHVSDADLAGGFDGVITGQGAYASKAYLFATRPITVDDTGSPAPSGHTVMAPVYLRYDFDAEKVDVVMRDPFDAVTLWNGLLPMLDAGPAIEEAQSWVGAGIAGLATGVAGGALGHHFMTPSPDVVTIGARLAAVSAVLAAMPNRLEWARMADLAHTTAPPGTHIVIGDLFATELGPHGRAAALVHEAVHEILFDTTGASPVDVPEWSGATIAGVTWGTAGGSSYAALTPDQAVLNPSSYAAFSQEVALGGDTRFGRGRPQE